MSPAKITRIYEKLARKISKAKSELIYKNQFELLISVLLSAQSTDKTVNKITPILFSKCPTPNSMLALGKSKIAKRFDTSANHLTRINRFKNPNALYPGQRIKVPGQDLLANKVITKNNQNDKLKLTVKSSRVSSLQPKTKKQASVKPKKVISPDNHKVVVSINESINRNRAAFKPVTFSPEAKSNSRIGTITVDFDETLSHYAEWSRLSVRELRKINRIGRRGRIAVNDKLRLSFAKTLRPT